MEVHERQIQKQDVSDVPAFFFMLLFQCKAILLLGVNPNHGGHDPSVLPRHPILTEGKYHEVIIGFHVIPSDKVQQGAFRFCINDTIMTIAVDFEIDARLHGVYGLPFYTRYVRDVMGQEGVGGGGLFLVQGG